MHRGPRSTTTRSCIAVALASCLCAQTAGADAPKVEGADGFAACRVFSEKNEAELEAWEKEQPKRPYAHPRPDLALFAPWPPVFRAIRTSGSLLLATLVPHVGAQLRGREPAATVSWPWSLPFGWPMACTRTQGSFHVGEHRPHRLVLEPGFATGNLGTGFFTRVGYRFLYHQSDWVVGIGGGVGGTFEIEGNSEPTRAGVSPELLVHFGGCCEPGYFLLAVRYDRFFDGVERDIVSGNLGFSYF